MTTPSNDFSPATMRVIDAAINRANEGLRVIEDYARMILDDRHLTERLKRLRHRFTEVIAPFNHEDRFLNRDTENDVGTDVKTESEFQRESTHGVVQANMARVQQSLRTIEEYAKTLNVDVAKALEPLRYESYSLEKALLTTVLSLNNLNNAHLYVLVDGRKDETEFRQLIQSLVAGGVDIIQLRDKNLSVREIATRARVLNEICRPQSVRWIMNDRADLCVALGADGVHLGQEDLTVAAARRIVGPAKLIGVSTHSIEQARQAVVDGANYIGVGPIFHSRTKSFKQFVGTELAKQVATEIKLPAFAIGGINQENLNAVLKTGIGRVAIKGAIADSPNPTEIAQSFAQQLKR
ncbi:MAG: thiamine phosphate synthase [Pirellulaceae bacterium]